MEAENELSKKCSPLNYQAIVKGANLYSKGVNKKLEMEEVQAITYTPKHVWRRRLALALAIESLSLVSFADASMDLRCGPRIPEAESSFNFLGNLVPATIFFTLLYSVRMDTNC